MRSRSSTREGLRLVALVGVVALAACGSSKSSGPTGSGGSGSGGANGSGGTTGTGGTSASGGATGTGGTSASGGASGSGGTTGTGGSGAGGTIATGGTSGGVDGATAACTSLFCDDFESGTIDSSKWKTVVGYDPTNTVTVESTMVAHGQYAAHAHVINTASGFAKLEETATFPTLKNDLWARAYFNTPLMEPSPGHVPFIRVEVSEARELEIAAYSLNRYDSADNEYPMNCSMTIPHNQWVCLEWHFSTSASNWIEVYAGGALLCAYPSSASTTITPFTDMTIGIELTGAISQIDNDVYIDDVAVDANRIGCL